MAKVKATLSNEEMERRLTRLYNEISRDIFEADANEDLVGEIHAREELRELKCFLEYIGMKVIYGEDN